MGVGTCDIVRVLRIANGENAMIRLLPESHNGKYWTKGITLVGGCTPVSEGCQHCWSAGMHRRFHKDDGLTIKGGKWSGKITCYPNRLKRFEAKEPTIFSVWNDLGHPDVPMGFRFEVLNKMVDNPQHVYLILTKRPEWIKGFMARARELANDGTTHWDVEDLYCKPNIYLGVTVELQKYIDRVYQLCEYWPGKKFVSIEPMLEKVDLLNMEIGAYEYGNDTPLRSYLLRELDWVIAGAETGTGARSCHPDWLRSLRDQCEQAGVPFWLKQINAKRERELDGTTHNGMPSL